MDEKQQCQAEVWSGWSKYRCSKNAKVEREGKWYCTIHDPIRIKEKDKKKQQEWEDERKKEKEKRDYQEFAVKYCKENKLTLEKLKELSQLNETGKVKE